MITFVYILECKDGTFYTGYTTDLKSRFEKHNSGWGAKYTRGRIPVKLVYFEIVETKSEALKREIKIKKMNRLRKEKLVLNFDKSKFSTYMEGDVLWLMQIYMKNIMI